MLTSEQRLEFNGFFQNRDGQLFLPRIANMRIASRDVAREIVTLPETDEPQL